MFSFLNQKCEVLTMTEPSPQKFGGSLWLKSLNQIICYFLGITVSMHTGLHRPIAGGSNLQTAGQVQPIVVKIAYKMHNMQWWQECLAMNVCRLILIWPASPKGCRPYKLGYCRSQSQKCLNGPLLSNIVSGCWWDEVFPANSNTITTKWVILYDTVSVYRAYWFYY